MTTPAESTTQLSNAHESPPLDEVMLAMDVVDTLRRRERLVNLELDEVGREEELKQRLRKIYAQQGIEVPDHILEQGVAALKEDRFTYKPPKRGLTTRLAHIYIKRGRWGKWIGGGLLAGVVALAANYFAFVAPNAALPEELYTIHGDVVALAKSDNARTTAMRIFNAGKVAFSDESSEKVKEAIDRLEQLQTRLEQEYTIQIINRQEQRSGVWRIPDMNTHARNYYLIVEAIDPTGKVLSVPIESEESGKTSWVKVWGLRVDETMFQSVANDRQDDGIIEKDRFGYKDRGYLVPNYEMPTTGGAITRW
ncbi:MAG: hypothetical protein KZQ81_16440 [Candidatus Thiodiazotropha sp. (ex Rostrolucina anterorostrata)]|nr:hypothetical protein [Candidatus Thiodiazotropha sp. (ex Rostrolucina anterorostrata)]